ncbi:MAG: hypothetical protein AAB276_08710, partial [Pseudomonadota bacterium]
AYDEAASVIADTLGNIYLAGRFASNTITFGSTTLTNTNNGYQDIFLVKYDTSGNVIWAKKFGGASDDGATSEFTDDAVNIYMGGGFSSSSINFGSTTLFNNGNNNGDMFIAKVPDPLRRVTPRNGQFHIRHF